MTKPDGQVRPVEVSATRAMLQIMTSDDYATARAWVHVEWAGVPDSGGGMEVGKLHAVRPGGDGLVTAACGVVAIRHGDSPVWSDALAADRQGSDGRCQTCSALVDGSTEIMTG